jgi:LPS export ABC transporter protein LptC
VGLSFLFFLLILSSCQNDLAEIQRFINQEETTYETISDFKTLYSDSAVVKVKIEGPTMLRYLDKDRPRQEFPDGMKVEFFTPDKRVTSRLTAKYGMRLEKDKQIVMRDDVVWESINKEILETSELIWDEKEERVFTNKFVVIRRPGEIITGYGFESNQDFTYSKIKSVTGQFASDKLQK